MLGMGGDFSQFREISAWPCQAGAYHQNCLADLHAIFTQKRKFLSEGSGAITSI